MIQAADVVAAAGTWVGVPFRHQGRSRAGVDCIGLPIVILESLGLSRPEFSVSGYGRAATPELLARIMASCTRLPRVVPGSLIVLSFGKFAGHVALSTGENMIHSFEPVGRVVEHGYRGQWPRITNSVWALPGVDYVI